jgi:hypothetical protein
MMPSSIPEATGAFSHNGEDADPILDSGDSDGTKAETEKIFGDR